eukprot:Gregarina_sp_Poly_1__3302@NODE_194_length_11600_cov_132_592994_g173_i0_p3_GENE_NODE_194_length_11600_cov_132_592994_g173_i0NODE_194_length_11600_cov_132_592994_g173_i0_p3_ORF_typecomplete_len745_score123_84HOOK/PF05622_12/4_9e06DUF3584/PF12128_8/2_2e05CEP63/PF17045_5/2_5e05FHA/PF00498_26/0_00021YopYscD_cpl/PF16697_5/0_00051DUF812/PF05667_11/0_0013DUF812/PF05667_11/3_2CCCAP/PF15964_5/0_036CCCAP/PF15964_5/0_58Filament/PF00038_21/6_5Filament/PF00038_21/20Filament/PF00038_21/0_012Myosin_tail_1/PF015
MQRLNRAKNMNRLQLKAVQRFEAIHLALQSQPGSEDAAMQLVGTPENARPNVAAPSRVWLVNLLDERYSEKTTNLVDPTSTQEYSGAVVVGRKPASDIVLKDRAISTLHIILSWHVEVERTTPSTAMWSPSKGSASRFSPGDKISISISYRDYSSNGTYEGTVRKPRDTNIDVCPLLLYNDNNRDPVFKIVEQPSDSRPEAVSLGRAILYSESGRSSRPVFAFVIGILLNPPWHEPLKRISTHAIKAFRWEVDPDRIKMITPEKQAMAKRKALVKAEPSAMSPRRRPSEVSSVRSAVPSMLDPLWIATAERRDNLGSPHTADIHTLKSRLQKLTEEMLIASRERDAAVASQKEAVEMLESKLAEVGAKSEGEMAKLNGRIRELETSLSEQLRKHEGLKRESEQKSSELEVELGLSRRKISTLTTNLEKVSKERDEALTERNKFQEEVERLELRRKQAVDQAAENQRRLAEVDQQRSRLQLDVDRVTSQLEAATAAAAKKELEQSKLHRALAEAEASVAHWEQKAKSMEVELSTAKNSLATSGLERNSLSNQIENWRKRCQTADAICQRQTSQAIAFCDDLASRISEFSKCFPRDSVSRRRLNDELMSKNQGDSGYDHRLLGHDALSDASDTDEGDVQRHPDSGIFSVGDLAGVRSETPDEGVGVAYPHSMEDDEISHEAATDPPTDRDSISGEENEFNPTTHKRKLFSSSGEEDAAVGNKRLRSSMEESGSPTQPVPSPLETTT